MVGTPLLLELAVFVAALTVLSATLSSCGGGSDGPPPSNLAAETPPPAPPPPPPPRELTWSGKVDMKLWSAGRVKAYKVALQQETPPTLAILRIPRLDLEVPVYDGTTDPVLDLAAGRIEGTALPGKTGNVGIAAHRDSYFRVLKDLKEGDALVLDTPVALEQYRVEWIRVTTPDDVSVIQPTSDPCGDARRVLPVLPRRFGAEAVHRSRRARGASSGIDWSPPASCPGGTSCFGQPIAGGPSPSYFA